MAGIRAIQRPVTDDGKHSDNNPPADALPRRRPGRPKGLPKPEGSGRQKGTPNRITRDIREAAAKHGEKALQALVKLLDSPDPKIKATAAREILDRAYGRPVTPQEITGKDGAPLHPPAEPMDDRELAQWLAFMVASAAKEARPDEPAPRTAAGMARVLNGEPSGEPSPYGTPALTTKPDPFAAQREQQRREIEAQQEGRSRWEESQQMLEDEAMLRRTGWRGPMGHEPKVVKFKPRT